MRPSQILSVLLALFMILTSMTGPNLAQEIAPLPLAEHGPHGVGLRLITFVDESREGRELETIIWYPAVIPEGEKEDRLTGGLFDAEPDASGSPYPLIVYSHYWGANKVSTLDAGPHLASYGYVVASASHNDHPAWPNLVNRPLDIVFLIDQLAALTNDPLAGLIDTETVGVTGYSFGGWTALMFNGTQFDPVSYEEACPDPPSSVREFDLCYYRNTAWDELVAYRAQFDTLVNGDLWPAITDERIRAVVPMAPCYGPMFGERGLADATVPTLIVGILHDEICPYERDAVYIYDHLGSEDRYLLTLMHTSHVGAESSRRIHEQLNHFATAFFGYYLQEREDYGDYLTADFVDQFEDLAWGPVEVQEE